MGLNDTILGRVCSGLLARFRKMPGRLGVRDLENMKISFSQHGEDLMILEHLQGLRANRKGIYIDAGCFDPIVFSNTRLLNLYGWNGINIDAAEDVILKFNVSRPEDYNVCAALSDKEMSVYLNGKEGSATRYIAAVHVSDCVSSTPAVVTTTIAKILQQSEFVDRSVDLLDIDCENHDLNVLKGFPFDSYRPVLIAVEAHEREELAALHDFLLDLDYFRLAARGPTHIYRDRGSVPAKVFGSARFSELEIS